MDERNQIKGRFASSVADSESDFESSQVAVRLQASKRLRAGTTSTKRRTDKRKKLVEGDS
jgi:hypothetical protein